MNFGNHLIRKGHRIRLAGQRLRHLIKLTDVLHGQASLNQALAQLRTAGAGEDALSYLLLSGQTVPVLTTMNAGELYVFFRLRCCNRAQWEIREAACAALMALRKTSPRLFSLYGPTCFVSGKCPEGKMTCGRQAEIRKQFSE